VDEQRTDVLLGGEPGLVTVVQVAARNAAQLLDVLRLGSELADAVDE